MKTQIKIFESSDTTDLQTEINKWLNDNAGIKIIQMCQSSLNTIDNYNAVIISILFEV